MKNLLCIGTIVKILATLKSLRAKGCYLIQSLNLLLEEGSYIYLHLFIVFAINFFFAEDMEGFIVLKMW